MGNNQKPPEELNYAIVERGKLINYKYIRQDLIADYLIIKPKDDDNLTRSEQGTF